MFSGKNNKLKADLKLSLVFGSVFWITALILYIFVFIYIFTTLRQDTRTGIQVRLLGYWAIEKAGGLEELRDSIDVGYILSGERSFFVRVADEMNNTVLLSVPDRWSSFNFQSLEGGLPELGEYITLRSDRLDYILEVGTISISGGYYLQVGMSDENRKRIMELLYSSFLVALIVLVGVSSGIGFIISKRFLMPVRKLERAVNEVIDTGKIESRIVEHRGAGELDELVVSFNLMLGKIEELVLGMKGALDTVAHDLRTPLTRFRMVAERVLSRDDSDGYREALEQAGIESETVLRMMTMLMDISEAETGTLKLSYSDFRPLDKIREVVDVYQLIADDMNISIDIEDSAWDGSITADADRFRQAVGNLIDNAVKYSREGGQVFINLKREDGSVRVSVADSGEGIPDYEQTEIWKRLYRGKTSKDGLGLGLSLVNAIVKAHNGSADVSSREGEGSVFTITFPVEVKQR
jgi:signal transduction histidine kinase